MATRILGPTGSRRRRRFLLFVPLAAIAALVVAMAASGGPIGTAAGFEDDDGNLAPQAPINFDWNSFAPTTWTGTAPNRTSTKVVSPWTFNGVEDAQRTTSDSAFAGGTKQDDECGSVGTAKAANKDDLKRIYIANETGSNGHVYLELAWVRIPQQTTSSSAHVAFEFNQGTTACPAGSDGLVHRTAGDMLIVYDFEGGAGSPTIKLERWTTTAGDACEVGSHSPPCWGVATDLTASGFAEGKVNTGVTVSDGIAPSPPESLGDSEFGEAGIDLTGAGVFSSDVCTAFGKAYGVSRSSGNSSTAQMKDLVGPANINIANCGAVIIHKVTVPSPDPTDTTFNYTTTGGPDLTPFSLKNGQTKDFGSTVHQGSYTVTESDPGPNFTLTGLDCSASDLSHGSTVTTDTGTRTASFTLKPQDTIECTYTNTLHQGAIRVHKTSSKDGSDLAGAVFSIAGQTVTTDSNGFACVDHLNFGTYDVSETSAPPGYAADDTTTHQVTVDNSATCADSPYVGEEIGFTDTPLSRISTSFESLAPGNPTSATIQCTGEGSPSPLPEGTPHVLDNLLPGTYTCTVVIDP